MLTAIKNVIRTKPQYILIYIGVLSLLLASSFVEYKNRYSDLLQLIQDQASMTAAVIAQSGVEQDLMGEALEEAYIEHAFDILQLLDTAERLKMTSLPQIKNLIPENSLMQVSILDENGERLAATAVSERVSQSDHSQDWLLSAVQPVLNGESAYIVQGFSQSHAERQSALRSTSDRSFLVAIPRQQGGAYVASLSMEHEQDLQALTTLQNVLTQLIRVQGIEFVSLALDNDLPLRISKGNYDVDSTWARSHLEDILYLVEQGEDRLLEIVRPIFLDQGMGEVRIGFQGEGLFNLRGQVIFEVLVRSLLVSLIAFILLIFLITRQNARILEQEKIRIEEEVYRLERLNRQREKQVAMGELAAGVAHEIRNPLNAIGIISQRLRREFEPSTEPVEYQELTESMSIEIKRINQTLEEFLAYTKPTPLKMSDLNGPVFLNELHQLYESQALQAGVELKIDSEELSFSADFQYMKQAISNLIRNAIEASSSGDRIQLKLARAGKDVMLEVQDEGMGIAANQLPRIFDLYFSTKEMGTGVGLALTHKIIADHQGSIQVDSVPGKGTTFTIKVPKEQ